MKKFISFVMAGAMVASLVPATAFAKGDVTATAKVVDAEDLTKDEAKVAFTKDNAPELQLKITGVDYKKTDGGNYMDYKKKFEVTLDNAEFTSKPSMGIRLDETSGYSVSADGTIVKTAGNFSSDVTAAQANAVAKLNAWYNDAATATDLKEAADVEKTAVTGASTKAQLQADAEDDFDNAVAGAGVSNADLVAAKAAVQAEKDKVLPAESKVRTAETDVTTKEAAEKAAQNAYDTAVAAGTVTTELADWQTAQAAVETAKTALETAKTDLAKVKADITANLPALETTVATEQAKFDTAVANIPAVVAAKAALETAKSDNATAKADYVSAYKAYLAAKDKETSNGDTVLEIVVTDWDANDPETVEFTVYGLLHKDDVLFVDLAAELTKTSEGTKATVSVDSDAVTANDLVFASVLGQGLKLSVKKTVDVATDEVVTLNSSGLKIESAVGNFTSGQVITLKLNNGFEFVKNNMGTAGTDADVSWVDDKEIELKITSTGAGKDELTLKGTQVEATTAKSGAVATITAKSKSMDSASCEVAKVVDYKVSLTVDADEDLPVIFSGTNVDNAGLTDDSDHYSLEVTAKETFPGAWSMRQGFNFNLPEGVYVTDVKVTGADNFTKATTTTASTSAGRTDWEDAFKTAYQDGDHKNFEFKKRVFNDVDTVLAKDPAELTFELQLVADPTFEGDVKLTFEGSLVDKQEVTIAKFVKPYTVKAEQNDVIIDYRNTEVKTPIVITEAEEGLWEKDATFKLSIEDDLLTFEDDPTFTIDADSDLKLKDDKTTKGTIQFAVKETSDKAASVTISDMKLFMSRSIPAGAYDLEIGTTMKDAYDRQKLYAPDATTVADWKSGDRPSETTTKKDSYVDDVCDYSDVVKAAFINVVTSGRDNDNLFTTKVVVPVGEAYLLAGEAKVELDAPAYISAAGYTMLPVRAISKALGVNTNNVLWNAETRTVTIMYAQRIITMTVGQKTLYVNGSAIPASAAPEIKDGRTFLPLRDLGTALGVTNVNWDAATKTATLN